MIKIANIVAILIIPLIVKVPLNRSRRTGTRPCR